MSEVKYGININMLGNRIDNSVLHYATTSPEALSTGQVWFDATNSLYKFWDGTNWTIIGSGTNAYWATLNGGNNTNQTFLLTSTAFLGPSGGGIVNSNLFNGSGILNYAYGGLGINNTLVNSGQIFYGQNDSGRVGQNGNLLRFYLPTGFLGVGSGGWLTNAPNSYLTISSGTTLVAPLRIIPGVKLSSVSLPDNIGSFAFDGTYLEYINSIGNYLRIATSGDSIRQFSNTLSIDHGGTNRVWYPTGSVPFASGGELAPMYGYGILHLNSGNLPNLISPITSGNILIANGTGWVSVSNTAGLSGALINQPNYLSRNVILATSHTYYPLGIQVPYGQSVDILPITVSGTSNYLFNVTSTGNLYVGHNTITFGTRINYSPTGVSPFIKAEYYASGIGGGIYLGTTNFGAGGTLDLRTCGSGNSGNIRARGGAGSGVAAGNIDISASGEFAGGSIRTNAVTAAGGSIDLRGINDIPGGSITMTSFGTGGAGRIDAIGNSGGDAGYIDTSASASDPGGIIDCSSDAAGGGNILTYGGPSASGIGGSILAYGTSARAGVMHTFGGGSTNARGGDLNTHGGGGLLARGGDVLTYGDSLSGGSLDTHDGGGSISTRGSGLIELGYVAVRTSIIGLATSARTICFPNNNGVLVLSNNTSGYLYLDDIQNVNVSSASSGQVLVFNGTGWLGGTVSGSSTGIEGLVAGSGITIVSNSGVHVAQTQPRLTIFASGLQTGHSVPTGVANLYFTNASGTQTIMAEPTGNFEIRIPNCSGYFPVSENVLTITSGVLFGTAIAGRYIDRLITVDDLPALATGIYAPTGVSYVTLGTSSALSSERVLTGGTGIILVDLGAGSTINVNIDPSVVATGQFAPTGVSYVTLASSASLSSERVLTAGTGITFIDTGAGGAITIGITDTIVATGLISLNGLRGQVQTFVSNSAGTDFGISSSVFTHTFSLPTSSATARGALATGDFVTFSNKLGGLVAGSGITIVSSSGVHVTPTNIPPLVGAYTQSTGYITTNQNDYAVGEYITHHRVASSANSIEIRGISSGIPGKELTLFNAGTTDIILVHQHESATAANRFSMPDLIDLVLRPARSISCMYDGTDSRWIIVDGAEQYYNDPMYCRKLYEDFVGGNTTSLNIGELGWGVAGGGTTTKTSVEHRMGVINLNVTTAATTDRCVNFGAASFWTQRADQDQIIWEALVRPSGLSVAGQEYYLAIGMGNIQGTQLSPIQDLGTVEFIGFEYERIKSANYRTTSAIGTSGTSYTGTNTSVAVSTGWTHLKFIWNVPSGYAKYLINGTLTNTHTTSLFGGNYPVSLGSFYIFKGTGNNQATLIVDQWKCLVASRVRRSS